MFLSMHRTDIPTHLFFVFFSPRGLPLFSSFLGLEQGDVALIEAEISASKVANNGEHEAGLWPRLTNQKIVGFRGI